MKYVSSASRIIVGLVFIFSGIVKGIDPLGSMYKFLDYFAAFNTEFLDFAALPMAIVLPAAEFLIGVAVITELRTRIASWALMIFMTLFTLITLILALTDPISDCGCFGDAIILTNWETFWKNIVLMVFTVIVFHYRKRYESRHKPVAEWLLLGIFTVFFIGLEVNSYRHLPILDFRPYNVGTYIPAKMNIPEGAPRDVYETTLYYEKDGEVKAFTMDNFPWEDTTWTYVDTENKLIKKGYEPPIQDFTLVDQEGIDHSDRLLADTGYSVLIVSHNISKADREALEMASDLYFRLKQQGHEFYFMTASPEPDILEVKQEVSMEYPRYTTDEITLKTIIRANPGFLMIKDGTILAKWNYRDLPALEQFNGHWLSKSLLIQRMERNRFVVTVFILLIALFWLFVEFMLVKRK